MSVAWPSGIDGLPAPALAVRQAGYRTLFSAVVLTMTQGEYRQLMAAWPDLKNGFWFPGQDGSIINVQPATEPFAVAMRDGWLRVSFDVALDDGGSDDAGQIALRLGQIERA